MIRNSESRNSIVDSLIRNSESRNTFFWICDSNQRIKKQLFWLTGSIQWIKKHFFISCFESWIKNRLIFCFFANLWYRPVSKSSSARRVPYSRSIKVKFLHLKNSKSWQKLPELDFKMDSGRCTSIEARVDLLPFFKSPLFAIFQNRSNKGLFGQISIEIVIFGSHSAWSGNDDF